MAADMVKFYFYAASISKIHIYSIDIYNPTGE